MGVVGISLGCVWGRDSVRRAVDIVEGRVRSGWFE